MVTKVTKTIGPTVGGVAKDFALINAFDNWVSAQDLVAQDVWIDAVVLANQADSDIANCTMNPLTYDTSHYVVVRPGDGLSARELENSATGPIGYGTQGIELTMKPSNRRIQVGNGVFMQDFRINIVDDGSVADSEQYAIWVGPQTDDSQPSPSVSVGGLWRNRIKSNVIGATNGAVRNSSSGGSHFVSDNLFFQSTGAGCCVRTSNSVGPVARNTFVRTGAATGAAVRNGTSASPVIRNNAFVGFGATPINIGTGGYANVASNYTDTATSQTGVTFGNPLVNSNTDVRPAAGSLLIGGANASALSALDVRLSNRGATPDAGAVQLNPAAAMPTGTVTSVTVSGQTVTVSGTTTNSPASGKASLTPTATAYNGGVAQGPVDVTLGSGTFSVVFTNVKVGRYLPTVTLTNSGGTSSAVNNQGNADVVGATGSITTQSIAGSTLTVSGTTSGAPTSGAMTLPAAAANPNGAITQGPLPLTLTAGAFNISASIPPGNYDAPIVQLTTAAGTSFPLGGVGAGVQVISIGGNPEAPEPDPDPTAPTWVTGADVTITNLAPTGFTITWPNASDNIGVTNYAWSTNGTTYTNAGPVNAVDVTGLTPQTSYSVKVQAVDAAGNKSLAIGHSVTTAADTTAPTIVSAAVENAAPTAVVLTASEAFDPAFVPAASAFTVAGHTVTGVAVSGSTITLTVTPAFANSEAARTAAYTKPATNGVRDAAGNQTATFTGRSITNNVAPPVVTVSGVTVSPATVTLAGGAVQQFNAVVAGTNGPSQAVTWTFSPALGALTSAGLFTAPATASVPQTITITATSQQDTSRAGTAVVTVPAAAPDPGFTRSKTRTIQIKAAPLTFAGSAYWDLKNPKKPLGTIDPDSTIDISFDWTEVLADISDTIKQVDFDLVGLTSKGGYSLGGIATVFVTAPTGNNIRITCRITTSSNPARTEDRTVYLTTEDQ